MNDLTRVRTLGQLKRSGWTSRSVKQEMRENLIRKIRAGETWMPGILGYDETVLKHMSQAILAGHHVLLLGLRGQGKTRILRQLTRLLDPAMPVLEGSEVNDDPLAPISRFGKDLIAAQGDEAPIAWLEPHERFGEKLATPDVSMADLIGDIDPVKALNQRIALGHEGAIQYGLIPRSHRGIFIVNELPDLQPRIQVGLLNILEEGDVQIRNFKVRLALDVMMAFSANPEDYTNRGNIITPLKDRIESQILTHYPRTTETAMAITAQEAHLARTGPAQPEVSHGLQVLVERIAFEAREDKDFVDPKSGVSARLPIAVLELLVSAAEARGLVTGEAKPQARMLDLESALPAITGKIELVYAGEQEGPISVARMLIHRAVKTEFLAHFRDPYQKKEKDPEANPYFPVLSWFEGGKDLTLNDRVSDASFLTALKSIPGIEDVVKRCALPKSGVEAGGKDAAFWLELLLEGLAATGRLSKENVTEGFRYRDAMAEMLGRD
jgi:magnesium chelatase subunit I